MTRHDDDSEMGGGPDSDSGPGQGIHRTANGTRAIAANIGSLFSSTVFERLTRFLLYAMVARSLGAADLGRLALAMAILQVIGLTAVVGIPILATRGVARSPDRTASYLVNGGLIVAATSVIGLGVLFLFVSVVDYEQQTTEAIWLLCIGLFPFALSRISEAVLVGLERAKYIAFVNVPVNLTQAVAAFFLLRWGYGIGSIALSLTVAYTLIALIQSLVLVVQSRPISVRPNVSDALTMVRKASPFLGIDMMVVLRGSSSAVIISLVLGESAVGIFHAAAQLQIPLRLAGNAVGTGLFPVMVRAYRRSAMTLARTADRAVELVIIVSLPAVFGLMILGEELLAAIYGAEEFSESTTILHLLAWAGLAMILASTLGRILVSASRELLTLRISFVNTSVQVLLSIVLTVNFGVVGAAIAWLVVALLNVAQYLVPIRRLFDVFPILPLSWRSIVASSVMALALIAIPSAPVGIAVMIGVVVYGFTLMGVSLWSARGWVGLKQRWVFVSEAGDRAA